MGKNAVPTGKRVSVIGEDREKLAHLANEAWANLEKIASIVAKSLGKDLHEIHGLNLSLSGLHISIGRPAVDGPVSKEEPIRVWPAPGTTQVCYQEPPGICFSCSIEGF